MKLIAPRPLTATLSLVALVTLGACKQGDPAATGPSSGTTPAPTASAAGPTTAAPSTPDPPAAGTAAAAKLPPPCSLITAGDASSTLGYTVTSLDSSADNDPDQISCLYLKGGTKPVTVVLIRRWSLAKFNDDAAHEPGKPQALSGLGTAAYLGSNDKGPVVLVWERGVSVLVNTVSPISAAEAKFLAKVAVGQLDAPS